MLVISLFYLIDLKRINYRLHIDLYTKQMALPSPIQGFSPLFFYINILFYKVYKCN